MDLVANGEVFICFNMGNQSPNMFLVKNVKSTTKINQIKEPLLFNVLIKLEGIKITEHNHCNKGDIGFDYF